MKRKSFWISMLAAAAVGIVLLVGLLYFERQDGSRSSVDTKTKNKERIQNTSEEYSTDIPIVEGKIETDFADGAKLLFTGDVLLSSYVISNYDSQGINGVLSEDLLFEMNQADILMVNEEFPFGTTGTKAEDKQFTFRVDPTYISIFEDMGTDIVSLANNHVLDFGKEALKETFAALDEAKILYAGAGDNVERAKALQTIEADGETYGFLAASRVIPVETWNVENSAPGVFTTYSSGAIVSAIEAARSKCDYLTVFVHWGIERSTTPEDYQVSLAHAYIDAGADLVIGSHPHVLQGIEYYQGKPIFYSLGNFIFNQSIEKTMLVRVQRKNGQSEISILPAFASGAKTQGIDEVSKENFYLYMEGLSEGITIEDGIVKEVK